MEVTTMQSWKDLAHTVYNSMEVITMQSWKDLAHTVYHWMEVITMPKLERSCSHSVPLKGHHHAKFERSCSHSAPLNGGHHHVKFERSCSHSLQLKGGHHLAKSKRSCSHSVQDNANVKVLGADRQTAQTFITKQTHIVSLPVMVKNGSIILHNSKSSAQENWHAYQLQQS